MDSQGGNPDSKEEDPWRVVRPDGDEDGEVEWGPDAYTKDLADELLDSYGESLSRQELPPLNTSQGGLVADGKQGAKPSEDDECTVAVK